MEDREEEAPRKRSRLQPRDLSDDEEETQLEDEDEESGELFAGLDTLSDEAAPTDLAGWPFPFLFSSFLLWTLTSFSCSSALLLSTTSVLLLFFFPFFFISFHFFFSFRFHFLLFSSIHQPGPESTGCQKRRGICEALEDLDEAAGISPRSNQVGEAKSWKTAEVEDDQKPLSHPS